ncbi:MAG: M20/M25/M40 family metallo-hydrolase, partial [Clostridia bacterium]|nr:M20/M25/M40 family metallo-hydrolase [Clostridia bacterium]
HGCPGLPMGCLALRTGSMDASCAHFRIVVRGRGGHSSRPHQTIDPVIAACALVMEVQTIVSRRISSQLAAVMSICRIDGGKTSNVIPDEVVLEGTARALDSDSAEKLETGLREITEHVSRMHRCTFEIEYRAAYPVNINAPGPTDLARKVIRSMEGDRLYELPEASMGAEDFAYFLQRYPGVYVKIGTGEDSPALHNSLFNFPDELLPVGIEYLVRFALDGLAADGEKA